MARRTTPARESLSRSRVIREAIALADAEGLEAVSMRNLAERLGVVPMALYKHVADKEDLVDGMVDELLHEVPRPTPTPPQDATPRQGPTPTREWQGAVRETILATRTVVLRHAWARRAIETRTVRTPAVLAHQEALTQLFLRAGLSPDLAHHVMHALGNRIWGFSPELFNAPTGGAAPVRKHTFPPPDPADYPGIMAIVTDAAARRPGAAGCDEEFEFRFALDLLLDGIARLHASDWSSTPG